MGRVQARSRKHCATSGHKKAKNDLYGARDLDLVYKDVQKGDRALPRGTDKEDIPGGAQWKCLACGRYFVDEPTLQRHMRTKAHKQRVKDLKEAPPTTADTEMAAGRGRPNNKQPSSATTTSALETEETS
ncbi:putative bud site selection protein 20 [Paratrimastix pyriformis]|uniref:Bud site selection protein 20 n=1 Tax=Paratrimastix pyriformis TaxID=342808 RepID=A0ABQ8UG92_9EUKA|nr:putative bud site selection protein 20 [Paratrimastix pyriformis]